MERLRKTRDDLPARDATHPKPPNPLIQLERMKMEKPTNGIAYSPDTATGIDSLSIAIGDTITVELNGIGSPRLPTLTLLQQDTWGISAAYQDGEDGPMQVYSIPWGSIRFISKRVEEE